MKSLEEKQEAIQALTAVHTATYTLLTTLIRKLIDDGVITKDLVRGTLSTAYALLEKDPDSVGLKARVLLEPLEKYFGVE